MPSLRYCVVVLAAFAFAAPSSAQINREWVGDDGDDWHDASNWSPAGVPGPADQAVIRSDDRPAIMRDMEVGILGLYGGTVTVEATMQINNRLTWSGGGLVCSGDQDIHVSGTAYFQWNSGYFISACTLRLDSVTYWSDGVIRLSDGAELRVDENGTFNITTVNLYIQPGVGSTAPSSFTNYGRLDGGGSPRIVVDFRNYGLVDTGGSLVLSKGGRNEGTLVLRNRTLQLTSRTAPFVNAGTLAGTGTIDDLYGTFVSEGALAPGASPGRLDFDGTYTNGRLEIEMAGVTPETEHDLLDVGGDVVLKDTLDLRLLDGYDPPEGTEFTVLTFSGTRTGTFDTVLLPAEQNFEVVYNASDVTVRAVAPLPVELVAFTATLDGTDALLTWETASETGNAGFAVEHRAPEGAWGEVGFVPSAAEGGTMTGPLRYTHRLQSLAPGTHTLRLRQVDLDGSSTFSPEVEVAVGSSGASLTAPYPNPASGTARMSLFVPAAQHVTVAVYDALGRQVAVLFAGHAEAQSARALELDTAGLAPGAYLVRAVGTTFDAVQRITVLR